SASIQLMSEFRQAMAMPLVDRSRADDAVSPTREADQPRAEIENVAEESAQPVPATHNSSSTTLLILLFVYGFFVEGLGTNDGTQISEVAEDFMLLWPALSALAISHGWSFYRNFIGCREYIHKTLSQQMNEPYKRVVVMHLTIIFGGFVVMLLETPLPALVLLIVLKIYADARAHKRQHGADQRKQINAES
ncbi:MAG: DUF6498-containing protein, partial [Gammaproteobacteria bacterium]|nr:DUF6498-containing protein [Gammaproteobacteria bacterium]